MSVELSARAVTLAQRRQGDGMAPRPEPVVTDGRVAAGCAHRAGEPGIDDLEVVWPNEEERPFRRSAGLDHPADDHPPAVVDAAGEGKLAGDAIAAVNRRDPGRGQDRGCDRNVE